MAHSLRNPISSPSKFSDSLRRLTDTLDDCEPNQIQRIADSAPRADELLEERERVGEIWEELRRLPPKQRLAICLRFEDKNVDDLWSMLWDAGICTPLETCVRCNEDLRKFREFVRQIEPAIRASHLPEKRKTFIWWKWPAIDWKFGYAAAALIIIVFFE